MNPTDKNKRILTSGEKERLMAQLNDCQRILRMYNNSAQSTSETRQVQVPSIDTEASAVQVIYLNPTLADTKRYAYVKMVDMQDTLSSILMRLDRKILPTNELPQVIEQVKDVLQKTSTNLNYRLYNLRAFHLDPKTFMTCDIGNLIECALADLPSTKDFSVEWNNAHDFCFYGEEAAVQAVIANILDVGYQVAYRKGEGEVKLWTAQHGAVNQVHVKLDIAVDSSHRDNKRWRNIAPRASLCLTLASCRKIVSFRCPHLTA